MTAAVPGRLVVGGGRGRGRTGAGRSTGVQVTARLHGIAGRRVATVGARAALHAILLLLVDGLHQVVGRVRRHLAPVRPVLQGHAWYADDRRPLVHPLGVLLHVLGQVRLLRVRLAAVLAYVRLQVFGLLVFGYVLEQRLFVLEALVARVTLERFVRLVAPGVGLQVAQLRKRLSAARVPALVRFVTRVRADVLLQVTELRKPSLTDIATVRLDAQVDTGVLAQVRAVGERLVALVAFVRFHVFHVQLRVQLQFRFGREYLEEEKTNTVPLITALRLKVLRWGKNKSSRTEQKVCCMKKKNYVITFYEYFTYFTFFSCPGLFNIYVYRYNNIILEVVSSLDNNNNYYNILDLILLLLL